MLTAKDAASLVRSSNLDRVLKEIHKRASEGLRWLGRSYHTDKVLVELENLGFEITNTQIVWGISPAPPRRELKKND